MISLVCRWRLSRKEASDTGAPGLPGYPIPDPRRRITSKAMSSAAEHQRSAHADVDRDRWLFTRRSRHDGIRRPADEAGSGAFFDLNRATAVEGWTSADAAGLAIFPGLIRYDEAFGTGEITHAFRVTTRDSNGYVWPASHAAGSNSSAPPMGTRLRLKASKNISSFTPEVQRIFRAMKRYGLVVADNGTDMYISGTMDARWNNGVLNPAFSNLTADDFEVVQLGWKPSLIVPNPPTNLRIAVDGFFSLLAVSGIIQRASGCR